MKPFKAIILATLLLILLSNCIYGQIGPLYIGASRCIFLKSKLDISTQLQYYDRGGSRKSLVKTTGYSVNRNISDTDKYGNGHMKLWIFNTKHFYHADDLPQDSIMVLNLYFPKKPHTINYYLEIPEFKPGSIKNIIIPQLRGNEKKIKVDAVKESYQKADGTFEWPQVYAIDLTPIVFPGYKEK